MQEKRVEEIVKTEELCSVEISMNAKKEQSWNVKVYSVSEGDAMERALKVNSDLKERLK